MRSRELLAFSLCFISAWRICDAQTETKTFVAYSMNVAQEKVEAAIKTDEDFRRKQPDLYYLGGITKPWAVVIDANNNDWILVGERDLKCSVLTLDDWVLALRARFIHSDKDPGVTIDPIPCEECFKTDKRESCSHYKRQDVRFFGGIEDTHFGQVCYEADWLMKRIGLGLERLPIEKLKTYYDLSVEQHRNSGASRSRVGSRFWFYPIVNRVNVFSDVVLLEKFDMGVFTEILYAEVNGKPVADIDQFEHYPSEGFSRSFSENYDEAAQAREVLETLRGLTRLAALAKGLTQIDSQPELNFFLIDYPFDKSRTPKEAEVLRVQNYDVGFEISGGVNLSALAVRLKKIGGAGVLSEVILTARKIAVKHTLSWSFETKIEGGQLKNLAVDLSIADPNQIIPLLQQGLFLHKKKRYAAAVECFNRVFGLGCNYPLLYHARALAFEGMLDYDRAIADYNEAIIANSRYAAAYNDRGVAYSKKGDYESAIKDFNRSIDLNPYNAIAYNNRGNAYDLKGDTSSAIVDLTRAIDLNPSSAEAYAVRGLVQAHQGNYDSALTDCNKAITLNPTLAAAFNNRGYAYYQKTDYDRAVADFSKAIELDPMFAGAFINRGGLYAAKREFRPALADLDKAVSLIPGDPQAHNNRGVVYAHIQEYNRAIADFCTAIETMPKYAEAYNNRGNAYRMKGEYGRAISDFDHAIRLKPDYLSAYYNKALACEEANRPSEAITAYRKFIELAPPSYNNYVDEVQETIKKLEAK